jgi:hypothetical protein
MMKTLEWQKLEFILYPIYTRKGTLVRHIAGSWARDTEM